MLSLGWLGGCSASHTPRENSRPTPLKHPRRAGQVPTTTDARRSVAYDVFRFVSKPLEAVNTSMRQQPVLLPDGAVAVPDRGGGRGRSRSRGAWGCVAAAGCGALSQFLLRGVMKGQLPLSGW